MIGKLKGIIESVGEDGLLLDVGGVCYLVYLSARSLQQLPEAGHPATIFIETHVREDHIHLYGFLSESDKRWFNVLCTVQGVGAKMALGILSSFTPLEIVQAIHARDSKMLTRASGVGPKLGERLVTELKNKVDSIPTGDVSFAPSAASTAKHTPAPNTPAASNEIEEAISALSNLGYGRSEAYSAILALTQEQPDISLEDMIRLSLQRMSR
ncbi:MAG: Holliday junction branch migration protein RuvA [Rickettsiales bacterium]|nr:Holliday junction branch migration protein RuvA [Rickettsiales bacterium]